MNDNDEITDPWAERCSEATPRTPSLFEQVAAIVAAKEAELPLSARIESAILSHLREEHPGQWYVALIQRYRTTNGDTIYTCIAMQRPQHSHDATGQCCFEWPLFQCAVAIIDGVPVILNPESEDAG